MFAMSTLAYYLLLFLSMLLISKSFGKVPRPVSVLQGEPLRLTCPTIFKDTKAFSPLLKFKHYESNVESVQFAEGEKRRPDAPKELNITVEDNGKTFVYTFASATEKQAGDYFCDDQGGNDVSVSVFNGSSFECPLLTTVEEGAPTNASCRVAKFGPSAGWLPSFFLMKKGDEEQRSKISDDGDFLIGSAVEPVFSRNDDNATRVACQLPSLGLVCESNLASVTWAPRILKLEGAPKYIVMGDDSRRVSCGVDDLGNPATEITVDSESDGLLSNLTREGKVVAFTLVTSSLPALTDAVVRCEAANLSEEFQIPVAHGPDSVRPNKEEIRVEAGQTFGVECVAVNSRPQSVITYSFQDEKIVNSSAIVAVAEMNNKAISCMAKNPWTGVESPIAEIPVHVSFLSRREVVPNRVMFGLGNDLLLACPFHGNPSPSYAWFFSPHLNLSRENGSALDAPAEGVSATTAVYHVKNASRAHAGVYKCVAENGIGVETHAIELSLIEPRDEDDESSAFPLSNISSTVWAVSIAIVIIVAVAVFIALVLRRKATGGKMDVEKGVNAKGEAAPADEEEGVKLIEHDAKKTAETSLNHPAANTTGEGEDDSFMATETDQVTTEGDLSKEDLQDLSFPEEPELRPGDERL